jgi:hypothetical protein
VVAVAIDDERRQQVGFAVHEAVGRRVDRQRGAKRDRHLDPLAHQRGVGRLLAVRQHPQRDLRSIAEERGADDLAARAPHQDDIAAVGAHVGDVGAIDPRVAAAKTLLAARGDDDGWGHREAISCQLT